MTCTPITPERRALKNMVRRCTNKNNRDYQFYGARGITVCDEWRGPGGFERFLAHIGPRPSPAHSVDRKDGARGYEPGNVRWATVTEQQRNRRDNVRFSARGETLTIGEWAERLNIDASALRYRLVDAGWEVERALTAPFNGLREQHFLLMKDGESLPVAVWARRLGMADNTIWCRLAAGMTHEQALRPRLRARSSSTARLSLEQAIAIKTRLASGDRNGKLAREFGVSRATVTAIGAGRRWPEAKVAAG